MTTYYWDSSALIKRYIQEPGSSWVRGLLSSRALDACNLPALIFIAADDCLNLVTEVEGLATDNPHLHP